jgi:dihydroorotase
MIRRAKAEGISVTAEVTPHHLALTEEWVYGDRGAVPKVLQSHSYDTHAKMAPPLRTEGDRQALKDALKDGTIDVIGTDHAPHAVTDKVCTFTEASNGIIGLETALALVCDLGDVDVKLAIERLTAGPSEVLRDSSIGNLKRGSKADITIIDPDEEWSVDDYTIGSKSRNTPLLGMKVSGRVTATFVDGAKVWDAEENGAVDV